MSIGITLVAALALPDLYQFVCLEIVLFYHLLLPISVQLTFGLTWLLTHLADQDLITLGDPDLGLLKRDREAKVALIRFKVLTLLAFVVVVIDVIS